MEETAEERGEGRNNVTGLQELMEAILIEMDKLKFYLPDELLYKINNPDLEFGIQVSVILAVIILISSIIGWKMGKKVKEKIQVENVTKQLNSTPAKMQRQALPKPKGPAEKVSSSTQEQQQKLC